MRVTEERSKKAERIDEKTTEEILQIINAENSIILEAISKAIPNLAKTVEYIIETIRIGGRIFFAGAGTSGRLGVLEVAELPPTFGVPSDLFQAVIAGGPGAVFGSIEAAEDDEKAGWRILEDYRFRSIDLLVVLSASGRTPFAIGCLKNAKEVGGKTVVITSIPRSSMEWLADVTVVLDTRAELVSGSTRMKAGTAQKIALNMLTTTAMIRLGNVHDGYMIGVQPTSEKLRERAVRIVSEIANVEPQEATRELERSEWDTKIAIIIIKEGITPKEAKKRLDDAGGILRRVLEGKK